MCCNFRADHVKKTNLVAVDGFWKQRFTRSWFCKSSRHSFVDYGYEMRPCGHRLQGKSWGFYTTFVKRWVFKKNRCFYVSIIVGCLREHPVFRGFQDEIANLLISLLVSQFSKETWIQKNNSKYGEVCPQTASEPCWNSDISIVAHHCLRKRILIALVNDCFQIGKLEFTITRKNDDFRPGHTKRSLVGATCMVGSSFDTNPSRKRSFSKMLFKPLRVLVWTKNMWKTKPFENDEVTIVIMFFCPSFPQTQIKN